MQEGLSSLFGFVVHMSTTREKRREIQCSRLLERQKKLIVVQNSSLTIVISLESEVRFFPIANLGIRKHCDIIICSLIQVRKDQSIRFRNCSFLLVSTVFSSLVQDAVPNNDAMVVFLRD